MPLPSEDVQPLGINQILLFVGITSQHTSTWCCALAQFTAAYARESEIGTLGYTD